MFDFVHKWQAKQETPKQPVVKKEEVFVPDVVTPPDEWLLQEAGEDDAVPFNLAIPRQWVNYFLEKEGLPLVRKGHPESLYRILRLWLKIMIEKHVDIEAIKTTKTNQAKEKV